MKLKPLFIYFILADAKQNHSYMLSPVLFARLNIDGSTYGRICSSLFAGAISGVKQDRGQRVLSNIRSKSRDRTALCIFI